eukprot:NODE_24_length_41419_cov_0.818780.p23 type:complete len:204 gc:universal NODE_24_length_41419_cov_0.818780:10895-11506(+)
MSISIIGPGNVGKALGANLNNIGKKVVYGVRNADDAKYRDLRGIVQSVEEAILASEIIILATPYAVVESIIKSYDWSGKILIDVTNPIAPDFSGLSLGQTTSGGELVQTWAVGAKVVKTFNTVGYEVLQNPKFKQGNAVMFVAGDDEYATSLILKLVNDMGFDGINVGELKLSRQLEQTAWLWIHLAVKKQRGRHWGFGVLHD